MAYSKQTWENLPNKTTPINAARLNHMEAGIYAANQPATTINSGQMSAEDKAKLNGLYAPVITGTQIEF